MRNSPAGGDGRRHLRVINPQRFLLIGNTRWHWAEGAGTSQWTYWHTTPRDGPSWKAMVPDRWAAVGPVPEALSLSEDSRVHLDQVPLKDVPPWLGIDRALAGWGAWSRSSGGEDLSVVDAGTVLSLTRVTASGCFAGGLLCAGLRLQLQSMSEGTVALPVVGPDVPSMGPGPKLPADTASAMTQGVLQSLLGLINGAQRHCDGTIWLCGGDAPLLFPELVARGMDVQHTPDLVMEAFVDLVS